jgi:hypothetical protein
MMVFEERPAPPLLNDARRNSGEKSTVDNMVLEAINDSSTRQFIDDMDEFNDVLSDTQK